MAEIDPVILQLRADLRDYNAKLTQAERLSSQKLSNIERSGASMSRGLTRSFNLASAAALSFAGIGLAREFLKLVDAGKTVTAQLRVATRETGGFAQAQEDVRRISAETRSGLEETAKLYGRIVLNSRELGVSQEDAGRATETFIKSLRIAGATTSEASAATTQFAQALASGVLRGDELRSILEASPRFARLLADSLGVTVGQLRALGEAGDLTADKLVRALTNRKFTASIDAEFKEMPVTFDQAMQQVENAAIITFGAFDRGGQFSTALATFITDGTGGFADLETSAQAFGTTVRSEFAGIVAEGASVLSMLASIGRAMSFGLTDRVGGAAGGAARTLGIDPKLLLLGPMAPFIGGGIRNNPTYQSAAIQQQRAIEAQLAGQTIGSLLNVPNGSPPRAGGGAAAGNKPRKRTGPSADTLARRAEQERLRGIREEMQGQQDLLRIQDDIIAARAALAVASEDVLSFQLQQISNEQASQLSRLTEERRLGDLTEEQYNLRAQSVAEEADLQRQLARRRKNETDLAATVAQQAAEARDQIGTLQAEAELARTREERAALEHEILDRAYRAEEEAIRNDAREAEARGEVFNLDEALINLKRRRVADEELARRSNMSPGGRYLDDLRLEAENLADSYEAIAVRGIERMNDAFGETVTKALGLHGVLGDIVRDLIEIAFRQVIVRNLGEALLGGGGGGGIFGKILGAVGLASGAASGGKVLGTNGGLKGFASGGSMRLGGYGGTDSNLLSLNGQPIARVSRGEALNIVPPNQQMRPGAAQPTIVRLIVGEGQMFEPRVQAISGQVSVEVVRASAPTLIDAASNETLRRASRPGL